MRWTLFSVAVACATLGCGDDTTSSSGSGGGGAGTTTSTTSSSDGGGSTTGSGTTSSSSSANGGAGQGGSGDGGNGQGGGPPRDPADNVTEACENLNAVHDDLAGELGCPVAEPGVCSEPDMCAEEILAFINCLVAGTTADDCSCAGASGEGGSDPGNLLCEEDGCAAENDALNVCFAGG